MTLLITTANFVMPKGCRPLRIVGAGPLCGKRAVTGTAAPYMQLRPSTDLYLTGGCGLGDGSSNFSQDLEFVTRGCRHSYKTIGRLLFFTLE